MEDRDLIVALAVTDRVTQRFEDHNLTPCQVFQANRSVYVLGQSPGTFAVSAAE